MLRWVVADDIKLVDSLASQPECECQRNISV